MTRKTTKLLAKWLTIIFVTVLVVSFFSCVNTPRKAQRKLNRLVARFPTLVKEKIDTVEIIKLIERIPLEVQQDTVRFDSLVNLYAELINKDKEEAIDIETPKADLRHLTESIKKELRKGSMIKTSGVYANLDKGISFDYVYDPSDITPFTINNIKIRERSITRAEVIKAEITVLDAIDKFWYLWFIPALVILALVLIFKK